MDWIADDQARRQHAGIMLPAARLARGCRDGRNDDSAGKPENCRATASRPGPQRLSYCGKSPDSRKVSPQATFPGKIKINDRTDERVWRLGRANELFDRFHFDEYPGRPAWRAGLIKAQMAASEEDLERYEKVLRDALEDVMVVAVRRGLDPTNLVAQFDANLGPPPHRDHTLSIGVRDSSISVQRSGIPHEWLSMGTGFIDSRFSKCAIALLADLEQKALQEGRYI